MTKTINGEDLESLEVKKKFREDLRKLKNQEIPADVRNFLMLIENIKNDPAALQTLREEIIKNYGQ